jgi:hypothetical protein
MITLHIHWIALLAIGVLFLWLFYKGIIAPRIWQWKTNKSWKRFAKNLGYLPDSRNML